MNYFPQLDVVVYVLCDIGCMKKVKLLSSFTKLMYNRCAKYLYCTMLVGAIQDLFLHINHRLSGRLLMSWFFRIWRFSPDDCPKLLFAKGRGVEQVFGLPCPARKYEKP